MPKAVPKIKKCEIPNRGMEMSEIRTNISVWATGPARRSRRAALLGAACFGLILSSPHLARAINLYSGTVGGQDLEINLDITAEYSNMIRTNSPASVLTNSLTASYGDLALQHGLVDNTFSAVPILDVRWGTWGMHFSGEAYLDTPYLTTNQYDSSIPPSAIVNKPNDFSSGTRNQQGENWYTLDAFISKGFNVDGQAVTLKVGRQTLLWGQSLIFTNNGIAGGMAPQNINTELSQPGALANQIYLPVGQVVLTDQVNNVLTLQGYYQFQYAPNTFEGAGAYFNANDFLDKGAAYLILAKDPYYGVIPGLPAYFTASRTSDNRPYGNGQFGISAQLTLGNYNWGLYALRFDAKNPELYLNNFHGPLPTNYNLVYPRDIAIYGASLSTDIGAANVAGEISGRTNQPLTGGAGENIDGAGNANSNPLYPVGDTLEAQMSTIYVSPGLPLDPGGITFDGEIQANHVLAVTKNQNLIAAGRSSSAASFAAFVTPTYYGVLPNLEVQFPLTLIYNVLGRSMMDASMNHGTGQYSFGITGIYRTTWQATLQYQGYLGKPDPNLAGDASLADRSWVGFNIQHTF